VPQDLLEASPKFIRKGTGDVSPERSSVNWFELYRQALLETHPDALLGRAHLARAAIRARLRDLPAPTRDEQSRMEDGLRNLNIVEREHQTLVQAGKLRATHYVTLSSREHNWVEVSEGICELLGYERSELLGRPAREFVAPELREKTQAIFQDLMRNGRAAGAHMAIRKDGRRISFDFQAHAFPDGSIISYWYPQRG
jgi:PAS domain S-box-containing protein